MKALLKISLVLILTVFFSTDFAVAQERGGDEERASPNASVSQTIGTTKVSITYGRPYLKGRTYFAESSQLAPVGTVWRTGANESTAITFSGDVTVQGEDVEAGTYSLYTIPGEGEWTVIINSKLSWGTQYDEAQDVIRVKAETETAAPMEQFMIYFEDVSNEKADVVLHWGTTKVPFTVAAK